MMERSKQLTIAGIVIVAFTGLGYASTAIDAWPKVGWVTPNRHLADIEQLRAETSQSVKEFRDEWKCDEYDEELREMLREQDRLSDAGTNDPDLDEDIRRLRQRMIDLDCSRFEK